MKTCSKKILFFSVGDERDRVGFLWVLLGLLVISNRWFGCDFGVIFFVKFKSYKSLTVEVRKIRIFGDFGLMRYTLWGMES